MLEKLDVTQIVNLGKIFAVLICKG
jgi:hypothetical protein